MAKQKQVPKPNPPKPKAPAAQQKTAGLAPPRKVQPVNRSADKWMMITLAALALLVNAATLTYDYTLDDPYFTKSNPYVKEGVSSIPVFFTHAAYYGVFKNHDASYRPIMLTSFAIEKQLFGFYPKVSHAINLLIFAALVISLFLLLRRIFRQYSPFIPFFIVLLFTLHPIHTEVIASIKSRDELMALLFTAMCTLQSIKYVDTSKMRNLILSGIYFFLALMSKETPVTFIAIVPLTIYFFRDVPPGKIFRACIPYLAVGAVYMFMRMNFIETDGEKVRILVNNNALMAAANYGEKLGTALFIQLKYVILLFFPHPLSYDYSYNQIPLIGFSNPLSLLSVLVFAGLTLFAITKLKSKNIFAYCILFYAASVIITSNILVDIGATMAERFVFTASLAYCIAVVFLVISLFKIDPENLSFANSRSIFIFFGIVAMLYGGKTIARNGVWKNNMDLYENGVVTAPDSWRAQYLLGVEYAKLIREEKNPAVKKEMYNKAMEHLNRSKEILPGNPDPYLIKGYAFEFMGNHDDSAITNYRITLAIDPANDKAAFNLGSILLRHDSLDASIKIFSGLVARDPGNSDALTDLGAAYGNKGMFKEAEQYYLKAFSINPNQPPNVLQSMSNIYRFMGDSTKAQQYRQLLYNALGKK